MPNKGLANLSASILTDLSKGSMAGTLNYAPISTDKWVYTERMIGTDSEPLIPATQPYIEKYSNTGDAMDGEIGSVAGIRIITTTQAVPFKDAGASKTQTNSLDDEVSSAGKSIDD